MRLLTLARSRPPPAPTVTQKDLYPPTQLDHDPSKKTLVILGSGWAATSFLKSLDTEEYNVVRRRGGDPGQDDAPRLTPLVVLACPAHPLLPPRSSSRRATTSSSPRSSPR